SAPSAEKASISAAKFYATGECCAGRARESGITKQCSGRQASLARTAEGGCPYADFLDCSYACATLSSVASSKCRANNCRPIGSFSWFSPQGTEIPGMPARFAVTV